ncbi:MAG: hypothetical protein QM820_61370 [Minicystis sp.]
MRRSTSLLVPVLLFAIGGAAMGCATYRSDLERARAHYDHNEYEAALALFRVLEPDVDSFSTGEHAQYAYSRGMTDYRLAALANPGTAVADPKASFRSNARHWLAVARAIEKETPGGLTPDEKQRLDDALTDLNKDVYGGADSAADASAPAKAEPAKDAVKPEPAKGNK